MDRRLVRDLLLAGAGGFLSPLILAGVYGFFVAAVWSPAVRYAWSAHGIAVRGTLFTVTDAIASLVLGAIIGATISYALGRASRAKKFSPWFLFVFCFVVAAIAPSGISSAVDLVTFFFLTPLTLSFLVATAAGYYLTTRTRLSGYAP